MKCVLGQEVLRFQKDHSQTRIPLLLLPVDADIEISALVQHHICRNAAMLPTMLITD